MTRRHDASPMRHPITVRDLGIQRFAGVATRDAAAIELGWSVLLDEMNDLGWPSRTPDDDRKPSTQPEDSPSIDYSDPTGEAAQRQLDAKHNDLSALQDHRDVMERSFMRMREIAERHIPTIPAVPCCTVGGCASHVETTSSGAGYRGLEQLAGLWVVRGDARPVCAKHRKERERVETALSSTFGTPRNRGQVSPQRAGHS